MIPRILSISILILSSSISSERLKTRTFYHFPSFNRISINEYNEEIFNVIERYDRNVKYFTLMGGYIMENTITEKDSTKIKTAITAILKKKFITEFRLLNSDTNFYRLDFSVGNGQNGTYKGFNRIDAPSGKFYFIYQSNTSILILARKKKPSGSNGFFYYGGEAAYL